MNSMLDVSLSFSGQVRLDAGVEPRRFEAGLIQFWFLLGDMASLLMIYMLVKRHWWFCYVRTVYLFFPSTAPNVAVRFYFFHQFCRIEVLRVLFFLAFHNVSDYVFCEGRWWFKHGLLDETSNGTGWSNFDTRRTSWKLGAQSREFSFSLYSLSSTGHGYTQDRESSGQCLDISRQI
jgi:hypothetical protein